jgi:hypothetical protein
MRIIFTIIGVLCFVFGIIDFAGMFFEYDLTGTAYSPLAAALIGSFFLKLANPKFEAK